MDIQIGTTIQNDVLRPSQTPIKTQRFVILSDVVIVSCLTLIALILRILLAIKLDIVTDEGVYILGGKIYFPLVRHLSIGSSQWNYNYEHPPFVKLLIGLSISLNTALGSPLQELFAARFPSILLGTLLVVAIYTLGRAPLGHIIALLVALCLAVSPWLVYFSALAYLDMTMTALSTIAYLLLWHAIQRPWLYLLSAVLIGLGADSKYTAVLVIPGMVLFVAYYFLVIRRRLPIEQRSPVPWLEWLAAIIVAPLTFLIADPAIWPDPFGLLLRSFRFEWSHSVNGHLTFLAGQYSLHVPHWAVLYIILAKFSAFVTIPAAFFVIFALIQLVHFHRGVGCIEVRQVTAISLLLIWLLSILGMFGLLNIVVGTHYHLPLAPPVALAGGFGLATLLRYHRGLVSGSVTSTEVACTRKTAINPHAAIIIAALVAMLVGPHLIGLTTVYGAEGYTSELFPSENNVLQVAYPAYREAVHWIIGHTDRPVRVGLAAVLGSLGPYGGDNIGSHGVSWYSYNGDIPKRLTLREVHPDDRQFPYDYLVWPMHLVQRGYAIPELWRSHIVYAVIGGNTVYCYILARFPATTFTGSII